MKIINKILFFLSILCITIMPVKASEKLKIHLFYSDTCPHCANEKAFLNEFIKENDLIEVILYEVTKNEENSNLLENVKATLNSNNNYVPYTVIGEVGLTGFSDSIKNQIIHFVEVYKDEDYEDIVELVKENGGPIELEEKPSMEEEKEKDLNQTITLPFLGQVDSSHVSLPIVAIIIGLVDGFNPCAMWILIFLISMLIGTKNRKRMIALGFTFLITSAVIYMLFMMAWLKVMLSALEISYLKIAIGIIAIIGAIWNLYSYYKSIKNKDVGCEVVDNTRRKKIISKIKKFTFEQSFFLAMIGIMGLAISVNFIEFACSAGWPVIFTEILALHDLHFISYFGYILLYILFYLLDDIIVFLIAMVTLEVTGISNKYSKYSHLIGGILMLLIGLLMIFKPDWLMMNF